MLKINNVSKSYGAQQILNDINLEIQMNKIVALAGPSGSGKSTLLRCIQKLEHIDAGSIECTETTGYMFQDFQLFPHMTVLENLCYAPKLHLFSHIESQAQQLLKRLGIAERADFYPAQLSGGQKQRVALARILMMKPTLLLCDEPTSGLDMGTMTEVANILKEIKEQMDISMIIASHDLEFLRKISDRIILLKNGRIMQDIDPSLSSEAWNGIVEMYSDSQDFL